MSILHIRCGDDLRQGLPAAGYQGDYLRYCDPLCQGPAPDVSDMDRFFTIRANYLADAFQIPLKSARDRLQEEWDELGKIGNYDSVILWFEHDIFDQAILIFLLKALAELDHQSLYLMSINAFPGVSRFVGFGQLTPEQLRSLSGTEQPVTSAHFSLAEKAWRAFVNEDPMDLWNLAQQEFEALPFLSAALIRHLQELPWVGSGLSQTEKLALEAIANGASTPKDMFRFVHRHEPQPFLGDAMFFSVVQELCSKQIPPLIHSPKPGGEWFEGSVSLTDEGVGVLEGRLDWLRHEDVRRQLGGVSIVGARDNWRWQPDQQKLIRA